MTQPPNHLRLFNAPRAGSPAATAAGHERLETLNRAFALATGWQLDDAAAARSQARGQSQAGPRVSAERTTRLPLEQAASLAEALAGLAADLQRTEQALCQREAELAAAVPVVRPRGAGNQLAQRLEAILRAGAESIGCIAAGLYLLDEATTSLSLRASWNLPLDRHTNSPRPLASAVGDLEALCGHAVAVEDSASDTSWNPPESFPAFVCVPVASARIPLGTLWFFASGSRAFSDPDVNVAELLAGRLAAELERESVLAEHSADVLSKRSLAAAAQLQQNQLPRVAPLIEDWSVAGWTKHTDALGGGFHDWMTTSDDCLLVAAAQALEGGAAGALAAASLRAAWRAHGQYHPAPAKLLERVNHALWTGSAGDQYASLASVLIDPARGRLLIGTAGDVLALLIREHSCESLVESSLAIGRQPAATYPAIEREIAPGDALLLASGTNLELAGRHALRPAIEMLSQALIENRDRGASALVELAREFLAAAGAGNQEEVSILVAQHERRRRPRRS
ncbi:MAG TPA: SpoIIE family protein phosphatase [Pirellulales bacterium]